MGIPSLRHPVFYRMSEEERALANYQAAASRVLSYPIDSAYISHFARDSEEEASFERMQLNLLHQMFYSNLIVFISKSISHIKWVETE